MALPDEKDLRGLLTAREHDQGTAGAARKTRAALGAAIDVQSYSRSVASSSSDCRARRSTGGCVSPRPVFWRSATMASGIDLRRRARTSRTAQVDAVAGPYWTVENTRSRAVLGPAQDHRAQTSSGGTPHGFLLLFFAVCPWGPPHKSKSCGDLDSCPPKTWPRPYHPRAPSPGRMCRYTSATGA